MRWVCFLSVGLAQSFLSMGARVQLYQSRFSSPTDAATHGVSFDPTQKAGVTGFFSWGWNPYLATGIEIGYQGVGQDLYGIGVNSAPYTVQVKLHYLRTGIAIQPQYERGVWGLWASISPGLSFLTQSELTYQGDSVLPGNLTTPQVTQTLLRYLDQSTDPNDRLILTRMYQRGVLSLHFTGGLRIRLAEGVWVLGTLFYERSFGDLERKGYTYGKEYTPMYAPGRRPVQYTLTGIQLGVQYTVGLAR
jgi:hypothetical protein